MRYLDIVLVVLCINLTMTLVSQTGIFPVLDKNTTLVKPGELFDANGNPADPDSMSAKIYEFTTNKDYISLGSQDPQQVYLRSGGDFLKGIFYFIEVLAKGTLLVHTTLLTLGVPPSIVFWVAFPIYLMYAVALIQLISNRAFEMQT